MAVAYSHNTNCLTSLMTSNNTPSPIVISCSTIWDSSYDAWKAFNQNGSISQWSTSNGNATGWLKVYSGGDLWTVTSYTVTGCSDSTAASPKNWTLQGSTNNSDWITVDTQVDQTSWTTNDMRTYVIASSGNYSYYKLDITLNNGNPQAVEVGELELIGTVYVAPPQEIITRDIVPRVDGTGGIGTAIKKWLNGYFKNIFATGGTISRVNITLGSGTSLDLSEGNIIGPITTSAGIEDANKIIKSNEDGKIDLSLIPDGISANIDTIITSSGAVDAGKVPALNELGKLDISFIPDDITVDIDTITVSSGSSDAGKVPALDNDGKLDISFFPDDIFSNIPTNSGTSIVSNSASIITTENLLPGNFINLYDDSGIKCRKAFAYSIVGEAYGYVLNSFNALENATVYFDGINTQVSGLSIGKQYLSADNPGYCTSTVVSGSGNIVQNIGFAISATSMNFKPQTSIVLI